MILARRLNYSHSLFISKRHYAIKLTLIEKIVRKSMDISSTSSLPERNMQEGEYITIQPRHVMTHDNTAAVMSKFKLILPDITIYNPRQPVFALDHNVQDKSEENLSKYKKIEQFASQHGIDFYPAGRGIGHQVMVEEGYAWPGTFMVGSDSHSNMYGGIGCLGTPVVRTDAAGIWATGKTWWKYPATTKVILKGKLAPGVTGKDIIITLCGLFNKDEVLNHAVEFTGDGVSNLTIDDRLTISNMTTEWGAIAGIFPVDEITLAWLRKRKEILERRFGKIHPRINDNSIKLLENQLDQITSDPGAVYKQELILDLSQVTPHVSGPNDVKIIKNVAELQDKKIKINKAYIVSCVNSRVSDLAAAASILRGKKLADHVQLYVAAASDEVEKDSKEAGDWNALLDAGAKPLPPGCGPCIGLGTGLLEDGEVGISATNRNFKGRMGSRNALCYLGSPVVVAHSALNGYISAPNARVRDNNNSQPITFIRTTEEKLKSSDSSSNKIVEGFPAIIKGQVIFCDQDNINTDGIYAGAYTYREDMTPEKQAQVLMQNYDPSFNDLVNKGDIVIGGYNFGTGSSREQAVTAFKYKGVSLLLAGSFSETYLRNSINNGYLCIEVPKLIEYLRQQNKNTTKVPSLKLSSSIEVNFEKGFVNYEENIFNFSGIGESVQEIIVAGGLENWVRIQKQK